MFKPDPGRTRETPYWARERDVIRYSETWTNPATGEWFVVRGHGLFNEVEATHVEGSIFEFRFVQAGQPFVIEDSGGRVVERNRGSVHVLYLLDTQGDDQPGGDWIADVDVWMAGPQLRAAGYWNRPRTERRRSRTDLPTAGT